MIKNMNEYVEELKTTVEPMKEYLVENYVNKSKKVYKSYCEHLHNSLSIAGHFSVGAFKMIIHGFFPDYYQKSTSECLRKVTNELVTNSTKYL